MEICLALLKQIFGLSLMGLCGFILTKAGLVVQKESRSLSTISVYILVPCMIFSGFLIHWTVEKLRGILLALAGAVIVHALYLSMTALLRRVWPMSDIDAFSIVFTNAGNIIIPLVAGTLGTEYIFYSSAYMVVQNILMWSYGVKTIGKQEHYQLERVLKNPTIIAIFIGVLTIIFSIHLPGFLEDTIRGVGNCLGPIAMIQVGILFAGTDISKIREMKGLWQVVALRLLVYPAVLLAVLGSLSRFVDHPDAWQILFVLLLAGSGPSAALVTQVAQMYDNEPERASCINVVTTLLCGATFPVVTILFQLLFA